MTRPNIQMAEHHHSVGKFYFMCMEELWLPAVKNYQISQGENKFCRVEPALTNQTQILKQAMIEKLKPHQESL